MLQPARCEEGSAASMQQACCCQSGCWLACARLLTAAAPQFVLNVEVVRLGTYALDGSAFMTPRSLNVGSSDGAFSEKQELDAMSSAVLQQWLQFTAREKAVRAPAPLGSGSCHALHPGALGIRAP